MYYVLEFSATLPLFLPFLKPDRLPIRQARLSEEGQMLYRTMKGIALAISELFDKVDGLPAASLVWRIGGRSGLKLRQHALLFL